ncbi:thioredoxin domain-containing protein [Xanthobacter dioxanivorans]|uniref:Thioredoxin domain-containing protein n=1 Tax=Xanthobacter dioxanivorans TaxID=2528964 RepID=A0A974PNM2_9HYPH|nr:thioredoxin domain-containing protein [Xanthobacter dioxanivorans]QRG06541.1 thioredoxin domain-containing protein [Xanthobacter dioxanivorans]
MTHLIPPVSADDHSQGPADAPVTLIEYGDYECPYCGEAYPVLKAVQHAMGARLRFVFRNFPLTEAHPHAGRAAEFAEAGASVGRFWAAHDMLYEHQDRLDDESLLAYGQELGIERSVMRAAFEGRFDEKIRHDFTGGLRGGVNGTPCLFINGRRYDGPRDVGSLVEALQAAAKAGA